MHSHLSTWTDSRWAQQTPQTAAAARGLSDQQRLVLGLVVFGGLRYGPVALSTGLTQRAVSADCASALRQLSAAGPGLVPDPSGA